MNHEDKVEFLVNDLASRGLKKSWAAPVLDRLLWKLGFHSHPPLFQGFFKRFFVLLLFGLTVCGVIVGLLWLVNNSMINEISLLVWGLVVGFSVTLPAFAIALMFSSKAKELNLCPWPQYPQAW